MLVETMDENDELNKELILEANVRKDKELAKVIDNISDDQGYLKVTPKNDLDNIGSFIKVEKLIAQGGMSLIFQGQIDWDRVDYNIFFTHILAHELAKKESIEEKLKEKDLTLDDIKKIDIDDDLNVKIKLNNNQSVDDLVAKYSIKTIRRQGGGTHYISKAKKALQDPDKSTLDYLTQRGYLKRNEILDKSTVEDIVKKIFKKRGLFKNGKCVIKIAKDKQIKDPRSRREQNFAGLLHENSVYIGLYSTSYGGRSVYVNEFFEDKLESEQMADTFTVDQSLDLTKAVARMVTLFKNLGAVNRDIKPDNVASDGKIHKLLDYGLADYNIEDIIVTPDGTFRTRDGQILGTANFMPPEQLIGKRKSGEIYTLDIDIKADFYTTMGTLYFLLTGKAPNKGETINKVLVNIEENALPSIPEIKKLKKHYLQKQGWKGKIAGLFTNYYRNKAEQYAHDVVFSLAAGLNRGRNKRYPGPEEMLKDITSLINLERPEEIIRRVQDEKLYKKEAFHDPISRPTHRFRKVRYVAEFVAGAAITTGYFFPDKFQSIVETLYNIAQKII